MSKTVYKDELVRIGALLDLPDDTEPTTVADAVQRALEFHKADAMRLEQATTDRDNALRLNGAAQTQVATANAKIAEHANTLADIIAAADAARLSAVPGTLIFMRLADITAKATAALQP